MQEAESFSALQGDWHQTPLYTISLSGEFLISDTLPFALLGVVCLLMAL